MGKEIVIEVITGIFVIGALIWLADGGMHVLVQTMVGIYNDI